MSRCTSEAGLGYISNSTSNAECYSSAADSVLGDVSGESGSGRLVLIRFLVVLQPAVRLLGPSATVEMSTPMMMVTSTL